MTTSSSTARCHRRCGCRSAGSATTPGCVPCEDAGLDERPRCVADRGDGLARLDEGLDEGDGVGVHAQGVGVGDATGQDQRVVVVDGGVLDDLPSTGRVSALSRWSKVCTSPASVLTGATAECPASYDGVPGLGELDTLDAFGCGEECNLLGHVVHTITGSETQSTCLGTGGNLRDIVMRAFATKEQLSVHRDSEDVQRAQWPSGRLPGAAATSRRHHRRRSHLRRRSPPPSPDAGRARRRHEGAGRHGGEGVHARRDLVEVPPVDRLRRTRSGRETSARPPRRPRRPPRRPWPTGRPGRRRWRRAGTG